ncbi:NADH dehydrogenase [ubiquinone] 1 beta subcomplex subunit 5, mitochondrial [Ischnura elegans]|uniref:NADH dehydrogenase [ubiquinone] 1 beta subcomplex subunit 5, mitochondrial n=1 Tax=Ischnura elegans TaxID=197161 RepID=UPI001ED8771D|nr:NADH dehydrogenase [ubiquinone] 1 beta subcomplex subunit 5, mitochondrial [Ischnura elegans]
MAGWSSLGSILQRSVTSGGFCQFRRGSNAFRNVLFDQRARMSGGGHRTMPIIPSRWQWHKFKDLVHFYMMVGLIPVTAIVLYCNIFIGPAKLAEIPEGYIPKHWEYYPHPITRFIAKYMLSSPQQEYEKLLHMIFEEEERMKLRKIESDVRLKMGERADYKAYYYQPVDPKYHRISREAADKLKAIRE